jgi:hypothetical protein
MRPKLCLIQYTLLNNKSDPTLTPSQHVLVCRHFTQRRQHDADQQHRDSFRPKLPVSQAGWSCICICVLRSALTSSYRVLMWTH